MKTALKIILYILLALIILGVGYVAYVFIAYHRVEDNQELTPTADAALEQVEAGREYSILSYNIGFGAYSADYSFFMDGGEYSRAFSAQAVKDNTAGAMDAAQAENADFLFIQEVDTDSTRSYHVDQSSLLRDRFSGYDSVFALNYDSPYLLYPLSSPHGKSVAGIMTFSTVKIQSAVRHSLPVEGGFMKFLDLDRCYSVSRVQVDNGKTLCLYNMHLSAYSSDGTIATEQLELLLADMKAEYEAGNYVLCGGDFNKDLLGDSSKVFGVSGENYTWAQSFPFESIPKGFSLVAALDEENPVPSARNADAPYDPKTAFVLTIDGFIVSDNISVSAASVVDTGFAWSDHNPVKMSFTLQ